jgi:RNA polymerase sigma-70 factor (ECF subfamily)
VTRSLRETTPETAAREQSEREWVGRIRAGDSAGLEALFRAFYSQLAAFAYRYVRSRDGAQEIVHDVLARIWERRERLEVRDQLRTYLYTASAARP